MTKLNDETELPEQKQEGEPSDLVSMLGLSSTKPELRVTGIYGDINEERCAETVYGLLAFSQSEPASIFEDPENSQEDEPVKPIEFYISTYGGQASEMFAVYDLMRVIREETPIHTHGIGKVMSAGVLLLAAGTKGKRRVGKNCRVMIHGVISGQHGHIADVENEFSEAKMTQKLYVRALVEETNMTEKEIRRMMNRKTNVYIDAEKAVELGIADIVF